MVGVTDDNILLGSRKAIVSAQKDHSGAEGTTIGSFRLIKLVGKSSMSRVYLAERAEGFAQRVAVKVLNQSPGDQEPKLLASLDHSNIVRLFDHGIAENGEAFLALEYVDGLPLDQFCDGRRLTIAGRLLLLRKIMKAVSYAHRHLVIHADLKPTNILVNVDGEPKVLDFGIARAMGEISGSGTALFTPLYASPEQRAGGAATIASDIYALGILAGLLLTGVLPSCIELDQAQPATCLIRGLSGARLQAIAASRSIAPNDLFRAVSGDLDAIISKALRSNPEERYSSVESFSDDILAHLERRSLLARQMTRAQRMGRWVERNGVFATASGALTIAILFASLGIVVQTARAEHQRRIAQDRLHELVRLTASLDGDLYASVDQLPNAEKARAILLQGATHTLDQLSHDPTLRLELAQQYKRLAGLRLGSAKASSPRAKVDALSNIDKGIALLTLPRNTFGTNADGQATLQDLRALRSAVTHTIEESR